MPAKTPAPVSLTVHHVEITRRHVIIHYENGTTNRKDREKDNPLPSFTQALAALAPLVIQICHLPATYSKNMRVRSMEINDKGLVTIKADKSFDDASSPLTIKTPLRFMHLPDEEGTYSPPLKGDQLALIETLIEEAKGYIKGDRAQGQLTLEDGEEDSAETGGEEQLLQESTTSTEPKPEDIAAVPKKGKSKKK